jgi:hypothetical protein
MSEPARKIENQETERERAARMGWPDPEVPIAVGLMRRLPGQKRVSWWAGLLRVLRIKR